MVVLGRGAVCYERGTPVGAETGGMRNMRAGQETAGRRHMRVRKRPEDLARGVNLAQGANKP